jgi:hypothetical protein
MASSLVQGSPKRNIAARRQRFATPPRRIGFECDLFDGDGQPPDQPRHLVQPAGIVILDRLRQPNETFVIAQRGNFAGNDRRRRFQEIGLDSWHRFTSMESGVVKIVLE